MSRSFIGYPAGWTPAVLNDAGAGAGARDELRRMPALPQHLQR